MPDDIVETEVGVAKPLVTKDMVMGAVVNTVVTAITMAVIQVAAGKATAYLKNRRTAKVEDES